MVHPPQYGRTRTLLDFLLSVKHKLAYNAFCGILDGWPKSIKTINNIERNFFNRKLEPTIEKNCLLWGFRIVIPDSLPKELLSELHASHMGIIKMKQLARNYFWQPNLGKDIERIIGSCKICLESRPNMAKTPLTPWK